MTDNQIQDQSHDHSYFCMMPNMLDDLLDPYEYRLYAHIKRVCGESGKCWQSTNTLAKTCKMSHGKVSQVKQSLQKLGLISITQKSRPHGGLPYHEIVIIDVWQRNIEHCTRSRDELARSPDELARSPDELARSPDETKKNPHEEEPMKNISTPAKKQPEPPTTPWTHDAIQKFEMIDEYDTQAQCAICGETIVFQDLKGGRAACPGCGCPVQVKKPNGRHTRPAQKYRNPPAVKQHRAIKTFFAATGYSPIRAMHGDIISEVGESAPDCRRWYEICHRWIGLGWNPKNVSGMLECFRENRIPNVSRGNSPEQADGSVETWCGSISKEAREQLGALL